MTLPFRSRRQPAAAADDTATETFGRIPDWDGTTITFGGASTLGGRGYVADAPGGGGYGTTGWDPGPADVAALHARLRARPAPPPEPPRRPADAAMPAILRDGTFGLLCGMDLWRIHFDPEAAYYRHMFDALRVSALRAGWRTDLFGRWCCPRCVMDPAWASPKPLAHWHPAGAHARPGPGSPSWGSRECWLARPATEYHADAADAWIAGDPAAEFWFAVEAEVGLACRTAEGAVHGRHAAVAR